MTVRFDTKIAIAVRADLQQWQKLNVTAFLASGIAASTGEVIGKPYEDDSGNSYLELFQFISPEGRPAEANRPICNPGVTHICLIVDDAWAEYERLSKAGMVFHCPPQDAGSVGAATYGRDPDGNIVELLQPAPASVYPSLI